MQKVLKQRKFAAISLIIILLLNIVLVGVVNAEGQEVRVFNDGRCSDYLKYKGVTVGCYQVSYRDSNNVKYPAYCLDRDLPGIGGGVGEKLEYNVEVEDTLTNNLIWRVVSNSYPYKSVSELGVKTGIEAFVATKQAVYCILYGNDAEDFSRYTAVDSVAGERVLALLKKLVNDARNSDETKPSAVIKVIEESDKWQVDDVDSNYISKVYRIKTEAEFDTYTVALDSDKLPEDTRIVNSKNIDTNTFKSGEKFKILLPINHGVEEGEFVINVSAKLRTCPVYYGKAPDGMQSYALAANPYEDGNGNLKQIYNKNNNKIVIIKKDAQTDEFLQGTEFNILDANKKVLYSNLITDKNGKVVLTSMKPDTYYLQEVRPTDGYAKLDSLVKFNMELDKEITLTVKNNKIEKNEINVKTEDINVNVEHQETNVNISTGEKKLNENNNNIDVNIKDKEENLSIQDTNVDINIEKEDNNTNIQNIKNDINIIDKDKSENIQNIENNINIKENTEIVDKSVNNTTTKIKTENTKVEKNQYGNNINSVTNNVTVNNTVKKLPKTGC